MGSRRNLERLAVVVLVMLLVTSGLVFLVRRAYEWTVLYRHSESVLCVAFSPDGTILASASEDTTIKLWHVLDRKELVTLKGHSGPVSTLAFTPDGKVLASGSEDMTVRLWDMNSYELLGTVGPERGVVFTVAFSPDGQTLGVDGEGESARLYSFEPLQFLTSLDGHEGSWNTCLAFVPDSTLVVTASFFEQTPALWDPTVGTRLASFNGDGGPGFSCLAVNYDGTMLATGSWHHSVKLWDVSSRKLSRTYYPHRHPIVSLAFNRNGKFLASATLGGSEVVIWDVVNNETRAVLKHPWNMSLMENIGFTSISFSPDGEGLVAASTDGSVRMWKVSRGIEKQR